jgi:hypothetical protein
MKKTAFSSIVLFLFILASCSSDNDPDAKITALTIKTVTKDIYVGDEYQMTADYTPTDLKNPALSWDSSDPEVATISNRGLLTAKKAGEVTISVFNENVSNSVTLKIYDTLFGYKFGSTMEEVKPDVKLSNDFTYNWVSAPSYDPKEPLHAFTFKNNMLSSIWSCYPKNIQDSFYTVFFVSEIDQLNPPVEITFTVDPNNYYNMSLNQDSLTWTYHDYKILIREGTIQLINIDYPYPMYIIEYSRN